MHGVKCFPFHNIQGCYLCLGDLCSSVVSYLNFHLQGESVDESLILHLVIPPPCFPCLIKKRLLLVFFWLHFSYFKGLVRRAVGEAAYDCGMFCTILLDFYWHLSCFLSWGLHKLSNLWDLTVAFFFKWNWILEFKLNYAFL